MKKIIDFFLGRREQLETRPAGVRIQSSCYPERGGFNAWAENLHGECKRTFLQK